MAIALPSPLPTPFDIADLPRFPKPLFGPEFIVFLIIGGCVLGILYLLKKRRQAQIYEVLPALHASHRKLMEEGKISRSEAALFLAKLRRALNMGLIRSSESLDKICLVLEREIYQKEFNSQSAMGSLQTLSEHLPRGSHHA